MKKIAQVVVGLPIEGPFDYLIPPSLRSQIDVGQRVRILFNRKTRVGFVIGFREKSSWPRLNPILAILDDVPSLSEQALQLTHRLSEYYGCSWGEAIETYLPASLRKSSVEFTGGPVLKKKGRPAKKRGQHILLHDQTRDQRWSFLTEQILQSFAAGQQVIFLVPEKILIPDVLKKLQEKLGSGILLTTFDRSAASKQELEQWRDIKQGKFSIIIGTRSAIFAPLPNLGLIILYEETNEAYKQDQVPHYRAHETAAIRANLEGAEMIWVSAAPSAEAWAQAKKKGWRKIVLESQVPLANVQIVDMTNYNPQKSSLISFPLQNRIQEFLEHQGKVILLMNRRGFSTRTRCNQCGVTLQCQRCDTNLVYMYSQKKLVCRHCNFTRGLPKFCPNCQSSYLRSTGRGIEKLQSEAARLYPHARVARFDRESVSWPKEANIIIATQALLREQEHISAALVAVLNFDAELNHTDFRCAQKAFSLLVHLRQIASERLLIQTRMIDNYCLKAFSKMNFDQFYREELKFRKELGLPPYQHLVALELRSPDEPAVLEQAQGVFEQLSKNGNGSVEISDPHPNLIPKLRDQYRYTIMLKSRSVKSVLRLVKDVFEKVKRKKQMTITVNVDP